MSRAKDIVRIIRMQLNTEREIGGNQAKMDLLDWLEVKLKMLNEEIDNLEKSNEQE